MPEEETSLILFDSQHPHRRMNSLAYADDLVREYLIFRGLAKTASMFEAEKKTSKLRGGFQAAKVIEQLMSYIHSCNLSSLLELWEYLNRNFFLRLDKDLSYTVKKLEQSLKRYYIVHCCASGHMDRVEEFFEALAPDLLRDQEWRHWFALRYLKAPASDPAFELYFSKQWLDVFIVSLHNFLSTIFQSVRIIHAEFCSFHLLYYFYSLNVIIYFVCLTSRSLTEDSELQYRPRCAARSRAGGKNLTLCLSYLL